VKLKGWNLFIYKDYYSKAQKIPVLKTKSTFVGCFKTEGRVKKAMNAINKFLNPNWEWATYWPHVDGCISGIPYMRRV
jgi:hypothetical protein